MASAGGTGHTNQVKYQGQMVMARKHCRTAKLQHKLQDWAVQPGEQLAQGSAFVFVYLAGTFCKFVGDGFEQGHSFPVGSRGLGQLSCFKTAPK